MEKGVLWISGAAVVGLVLYLVYLLLCEWPAVSRFMPGCL